MSFGIQEKPRGSADGQVHGTCPDYYFAIKKKPEYLGIVEGLFREPDESGGFLFQNNAHIKFPFNSRRVQNSPEAHGEPVQK